MLLLKELNNDQRREVVNTRQRFTTWLDLKARKESYRGSVAWATSQGRQYLVRSSYDGDNVRRQKSLGPRTPETEKMKDSFERNRAQAREDFSTIDTILRRQAAINRAVDLGRVPVTAAAILRAVDKAGLLGAGLRVLGTHAIFAFEAAAGVMIDAELLATEDIDLLLDNRRKLNFILSDDVPEKSLLKILKSVDPTFTLGRQSYRAQNAQGYMVDLIKPLRLPMLLAEADKLASPDDLTASEIEGLIWLESAPAFKAIVIDDRGFPLHSVTVDPRAWAIHKHWLSQRADRDPLKKRRDADQARAVAAIVNTYLPQLPFDPDSLRMLPKAVVSDAAALFAS